MAEFHKSIVEGNDFECWDIYLRGQKIGTLRKELFVKIKNVQHGGKYYLTVLYRDYVLPFKAKNLIPKIVKGAIDSMEADIIMGKLEETDWYKSKVELCDKYNKLLNNKPTN